MCSRTSVCVAEGQMATSPASLTVPGVLDAVPQVRLWLSDVLGRWHLPAPDTADLALAVTEICTNIARHGYRDTTGDIEIRVTREAGAIQVTILDQAPRFVLDEPPPSSPDALVEGATARDRRGTPRSRGAAPPVMRRSSRVRAPHQCLGHPERAAPGRAPCSS